MGDALQLDKLGIQDWASVKRMITPASVRKINEGIVRIWPISTNVERALARTDDRQAGLYAGDYRPHKVIEAVGRHLVYADVVTLADPFIYPLSLREEFSPLLHPEKHRTNTAKNVHLWFALFPLIKQGLVEVVRSPSDFDPRLNMENLRAMEDLHKRNPDLMATVEKFSKEYTDNEFSENKEWFMLMQSDSRLRQILQEESPDISAELLEGTINHIRQRRDDHPFFMPTGDEMVAETFGATAYDSLQIANLTGAYLLTDLEPRWKQLETVKRELGERVDIRTKVAHSLQNLTVPMASHLNLELAKQIREKGQLQRVRGLLNNLMRDASSDSPLSEEDARAFQHELADAIAEAKDEYASIDRDLMKWVGVEATLSAVGFLSVAPATLTVSLGAMAVAGLANLGVSTWRRRTFADRFPAGMFMRIPVR